MAMRTKSGRKGKTMASGRGGGKAKKTAKRTVKKTAAKKSVRRRVGASPKRTKAPEPEITLHDVIKLAAALRARKREALAKFASKAAGVGDPMMQTRLKIVRRRYEALIGPHSPGEGEDDSALPSYTMKIGGPRGGGEPEDA